MKNILNPFRNRLSRIYSLASEIGVVASSFVNTLRTTDDTVQSALSEIDRLPLLIAPNKVAGRFYHTLVASAPGSATAMSANSGIYYIPYPVCKPETDDRVGLWTSVAINGAKVQFGLYDSDGLVPTSLIEDWGEFVYSGTSAQLAVKTINRSLDRKLYFLGVEFEQAVTVFVDQNYMDYLGREEADLNTSRPYGYYKETRTYATGLPANAGNLLKQNAVMPQVSLRFVS